MEDVRIPEAFTQIGTRVWDTAICMSKSFEHLKGELPFADARILEIGAGCGLLGLVLKRLFPNCELTMTEIGVLLDRLTAHVAQNGFGSDSKLTCKILDWFKTDLVADFEAPGSYHVILASDIAVDPNDIPHICRLLSHFVQGQTVCYIGCVTIREAYHPFVDAISALFDVSEIPEEHYHPNYKTNRIKVFRIVARA
mgnify:CR=1 FL=1